MLFGCVLGLVLGLIPYLYGVSDRRVRGGSFALLFLGGVLMVLFLGQPHRPNRWERAAAH